MDADLARLLAALGASEPPTADDAPRGLGRPPALTPAQVRSIRRRRALPLDQRPRLAELAAEFRVHVVTVRKALQAAPPYDWGDPAPRKGGRHRTRGSQRFRD